MAVYNGEKYLSEQINSILGQSYKEWQLLIRDDGSRDTSPDIIKDYARRYPDNIRLITDQDGNIGVSQNFLRLLDHADTDYVMFCDQDDIWLPDKIEAAFAKIEDMESQFGKETPVLVHSDLKVCDKNMNIIMDSLWKYQYLDPTKGVTLNRLLVQNVVTGLSVMINKSLKQLIHSIPKDAISYDWWISLAAAAFGKIGYIKFPTALYRQHENNAIGAKKWQVWFAAKTFLFGKDKMLGKSAAALANTILLKTQWQAKAFLDVFKNELTEKYIDLLNVYLTLDRQSFFVKRRNLIKYRFFKIGFLRNIGLFLTV